MTIRSGHESRLATRTESTGARTIMRASSDSVTLCHQLRAWLVVGRREDSDRLRNQRTR
jgi:hypothetical protein